MRRSSTPPDPPLTYTVAQLAERLQISPRQIRRLREAGTFPFDPIPDLGALRFSRLEVERRLTDVASLRVRARRR